MSAGLIILNRGTEPTFMDSRRQEVIDITVCTGRLADWVLDWRVSNEPSGSDHRSIHLSIHANPVSVWSRNPRQTDWGNYRLDLTARLEKAPSRFHDKKDLEVAAGFISDTIVEVYELNCPLKRNQLSTKVPWWNKELAKLRSEVRKLFNKARKTGADSHWERFRSSQRGYSKAIVNAKRNSWREFCEGVESVTEASRLHRILSSENRPTLGCLKRPDGTYTDSKEETLKLLMETHFPGFQESDHAVKGTVTEHRAHKPREWSLAAKVVYPKGVEWAIKTFRPYKSPGPDGIYPALLQEGIRCLVGPLTKVFRASIALRHVPKVWGGTKVVLIPKPGRNGHILAKDFRPISLTSFLLKTLERLVDRFLKDGPLIHYPLSSAQYAYREGRSTETALHHLVSMVETQLDLKGYALGVFLDIEGAFDSTSYNVIKEAMVRHGIPDALGDWTQCMLSNRRLLVSHGDTILEGVPARGCPQGGVLSPLLWCLVVDELLRRLQKADLLVFGYADDVAVLVRGSFLSVLKELMDDALKIVQTWCQDRGLKVNPAKTEAMIFTRKYKPEPSKPLKLWNRELRYSSSIRYLGVLLDPKLNWRAHLLNKRAKLYASLAMCRRAMGKTWGMKPGIALWLYKAVLLPKLTYAAIVWWPRVERVEAKNLLRSLQGSYLRAAVGAMKSTPAQALEVALCFPPLDQKIIELAKLTAYRLKCQGEWRETGRGHTGLRFLREAPFTFRQDRIPKRVNAVKLFLVEFPTRKDWSNPGFLSRPEVDVWFTDGSGCNGRFGAGIYGTREDHRESIPMGALATVFQAEVLAISECAKHLVAAKTANRKIAIYSDSRSAIGALAKPATESDVVWEGMLALNKLGETNRVTLVWIPGHQGIHGNEVADGLAKAGTREVPLERIVGVPFATGRKLIADQLERDHARSWSGAKGCRQAKAAMRQPSAGRTKELLSMSKGRLRICIGLLTGHVALRAHLSYLGLANQTSCRLCGEDREDSIHILCNCPSLVLKRYRFLGSMFLSPQDLHKTKVNNLYSLANNAGLGL